MILISKHCNFACPALLDHICSQKSPTANWFIQKFLQESTCFSKGILGEDAILPKKVQNMPTFPFAGFLFLLQVVWVYLVLFMQYSNLKYVVLFFVLLLWVWDPRGASTATMLVSSSPIINKQKKSWQSPHGIYISAKCWPCSWLMSGHLLVCACLVKTVAYYHLRSSSVRSVHSRVNWVLLFCFLRFNEHILITLILLRSTLK